MSAGNGHKIDPKARGCKRLQDAVNTQFSFTKDLLNALGRFTSTTTTTKEQDKNRPTYFMRDFDK